MLRKDSTSIQNLSFPAGAEATLERLFPKIEDSSTLVVTCRRGDYSASRIARAVEDADAHLLNLNVTADSERTDSHIVAELRVSHRVPEAVARSLERYGYEVIGLESSSDVGNDDVMRSRYDELMRYLEI